MGERRPGLVVSVEGVVGIHGSLCVGLCVDGLRVAGARPGEAREDPGAGPHTLSERLFPAAEPEVPEVLILEPLFVGAIGTPGEDRSVVLVADL